MDAGNIVPKRPPSSAHPLSTMGSADRSESGKRHSNLVGLSRTTVRVACATVYDPRDPGRYGAGRVYHQLETLRQEVDRMYYVGPLSHWRLGPLLLAKRAYYRHIKNQHYHPKRDRQMVREYSRQIARRLKTVDANIVFSPFSLCSQPIAYLDCMQPIVIWTDTTWAGVLDFYPDFHSSEICAETLRDAAANERSALLRAKLVVYYSDWAAQSAIRLYGVDPAKIRVIAPGPAIAFPLSAEEASDAVHARPADQCRLLFIGEHWERKGGIIALDVAKRLNAVGLPTSLAVVGCRPPRNENLPAFVKVFGYIDRASREGEARMRNLLTHSHFLIVPSRAEAFGLVYAEASAFALPSLATAVGGTPTAVRSGINGQTFALTASPEAYAAFIGSYFARFERYRELAFSSFSEYETRLNNRMAAKSLRRAMEEIL